MPGWLKWKKPNLLARRPTGPVPFDIQCVCGRESYGYRTARYQQVICLDCGEPLFVLPLNVYPSPPPTEQDPEPAALDSSQSPSKIAVDDFPPDSDQDLLSEIEDLKQDIPGGSRSAAKQKSARKKSASKSATGKSAPSQSAAGKSAAEIKPDAVPLSKIKRPAKRLVTPFRLTLVAIAAVLVGTVWLSLKSSSYAAAEVVLHDATINAFTAVAEGDAYTAVLEFQKAADAADVVIPDSNQAKMLRYMLRQATVVTSLSADSLLDILMRADEIRETQPDSWRENLGLADADWLVFDSTARQTIGPDGEGLVEITFPLAVGDADVVMNCEAIPFSPLGLQSDPTRLIFAARVQSVDYRSSQPAQWTVHLDPDSVVIWSSEGLFAALGFESDDSEWDQETSKLLASQQQDMGIEE